MNNYYRQVMTETTQSYPINAGVPWFMNINGTNITTRSNLQNKASIDFMVDAIAVTVLADNPDNPDVGDCAPTPSYRINFRDSLSQTAWIDTNVASDTTNYEPVPGNLIAGLKPTPLPSPRPLYQNTIFEVTIEPVTTEGAADDKVLDYVNITLYGRRMDTMPQWERDQVCGDPRTSGATWIYPGPLVLEREDSASNPCGRGPDTAKTVRFATTPFDYVITGLSGFMADPRNTAIPVGRAMAEFNITDLNTRHMLFQEYAPTTILGGHINCSTVITPTDDIPCAKEQMCMYYPRSMALYSGWSIQSQTGIEINARSVFSPINITTSSTQVFQLMLSGMRVPSSEIAVGFPYYNREDGSLRCPPGSSGLSPGTQQMPGRPYYPNQ